MNPNTWIALGALAVSAVAVILNLSRVARHRRRQGVEDSAERTRAATEAKLSSIEAAERVVALYGATVRDLMAKVDRLEKRVAELEMENDRLRAQVQLGRST